MATHKWHGSVLAIWSITVICFYVFPVMWINEINEQTDKQINKSSLRVLNMYEVWKIIPRLLVKRSQKTTSVCYDYRILAWLLFPLHFHSVETVETVEVFGLFVLIAARMRMTWSIPVFHGSDWITASRQSIAHLYQRMRMGLELKADKFDEVWWWKSLNSSRLISAVSLTPHSKITHRQRCTFY